MNRTNPIDAVHELRIAELEAENARLRQSLERVKAERRELSDQLYGPFPIEDRTTEEEMVEIMKSIVPGDGKRFFTEVGLLPGSTK